MLLVGLLIIMCCPGAATGLDLPGFQNDTHGAGLVNPLARSPAGLWFVAVAVAAMVFAGAIAIQNVITTSSRTDDPLFNADGTVAGEMSAGGGVPGVCRGVYYGRSIGVV